MEPTGTALQPPQGQDRGGRAQGDLARRGLRDLQGIVDFLARSGDLVRVKTPVDARHELAGVAARFNGGKVVLFERVRERAFPVLTGLYWNRDVLARVFGVPVRELSFFFADVVAEWQREPVHPVVVDRAPCQEVAVEKFDLRTDLPIPTSGLLEGGPYITSAVVVAKDPDTGVRNASIMRFMVTGPNRLTCQMDFGRHLRDYYERAEARGQPLEITINNGVTPAEHIAAVVPANAAPIDTDELGIASHLLGEPLQLVPARTVGVEAIANAQVVIEAEVLPRTRELEGPAAEVTGYYAAQDQRWTAHVKCVTRRREPIWHNIMPGLEVYNAVGLMAEASIYRNVKRLIPALQDVYLSHGGCGFYHAIIQLKKNTEGVQRNAILATFAAFPSLKMVTAVDDDVNIHDPRDVEWALATRFWPDRDIILVPNSLCHELNPTTDHGIGTKIGIDATRPYPHTRSFERVRFQPVDLSRYEIEQ